MVSHFMSPREGAHARILDALDSGDGIGTRGDTWVPHWSIMTDDWLYESVVVEF
jgi:hypothetical protein